MNLYYRKTIPNEKRELIKATKLFSSAIKRSLPEKCRMGMQVCFYL